MCSLLAVLLSVQVNQLYQRSAAGAVESGAVGDGGCEFGYKVEVDDNFVDERGRNDERLEWLREVFTTNCII